MSRIAKKPICIRLLHWGVVFWFCVALLTGYIAFDFDLQMSIRMRDRLFAVHRLSGMISGLLFLAWAACRVRSLLGISRSLREGGIAAFHIGFATICLLIPVTAWIARSLDGRSHELYAFLPQANLVSHPTTLLTYKLLHLHKQLIDLAIILVGIHLAAVIFHNLLLKDGSLRSMLFSK